MSRSERTDLPNPAKRFMEWGAEKGQLQFYDKEKKENIAVKLPFSFMVLDEVSQVGGGTKRSGKFEGFWSNAVKNLSVQELIVKSKDGVEARGLYRDIKDKKGFNYIKGLYIAYHDDDKELQIGFLKFKGSSLGAWFDYTKVNRDIYAGAITIKSKSDVIKGEQGDYFTPVLIHKPEISEESEAAAVELDKELQTYLRRYFAMQGIEQAEQKYSGGGQGDAWEGDTRPMDDPTDEEAPESDDIAF